MPRTRQGLNAVYPQCYPAPPWLQAGAAPVYPQGGFPLAKKPRGRQPPMVFAGGAPPPQYYAQPMPQPALYPVMQPGGRGRRRSSVASASSGFFPMQLSQQQLSLLKKGQRTQDAKQYAHERREIAKANGVAVENGKENVAMQGVVEQGGIKVKGQKQLSIVLRRYIVHKGWGEADAETIYGAMTGASAADFQGEWTPAKWADKHPGQLKRLIKKALSTAARYRKQRARREQAAPAAARGEKDENLQSVLPSLKSMRF